VAAVFRPGRLPHAGPLARHVRLMQAKLVNRARRATIGDVGANLRGRAFRSVGNTDWGIGSSYLAALLAANPGFVRTPGSRCV
jgi:hypothetical protein